jgi:hypothetical protein
MKVTTTITLDDAALEDLRAYAARHHVSLPAALARLALTGARRAAAISRYETSARGRRVRRLARDRCAERVRSRRRTQG